MNSNSQSQNSVQSQIEPLVIETPTIPGRRGRGRPCKDSMPAQTAIQQTRYERSISRQRSGSQSSVSEQSVSLHQNVEEEKKQERNSHQTERSRNKEAVPQIAGATSIRKRFTNLNLRSPFTRHRSASQQLQTPSNQIRTLRLTPVIEELTQLHLTSTVKKPRDDFQFTPHETPVLLLEIPQWDQDEFDALQIPPHSVQIPQQPQLSRLEMIR